MNLSFRSWWVCWLLLCCLSFCGLGFAQAIDIIPSAQSSAYVDLGRGLSWGASGPNGIQNNFVFSPLTPDQGVCLYLHNYNPVSTHTITLAIWETGDQQVANYLQFVSSYVPISINQGVTDNTIQLFVAPSSTTNYFFKSSGAAQIAILVTNTGSLPGSPDVVDFLAVQTNQNCGQNSRVPIYCNQIVNTPVPFGSSGGNILAISNTLLTGSIHVCGLWFTSTKDWTAATNVSVTIVQGTTGSNCSGSAIAGALWQIIAATAFAEVPTGGSELLESNSGVSLCVKTGAFTAGTVNVVISYIIF